MRSCLGQWVNSRDRHSSSACSWLESARQRAAQKNGKLFSTHIVVKIIIIIETLPFHQVFIEVVVLNKTANSVKIHYECWITKRNDRVIFECILHNDFVIHMYLVNALLCLQTPVTLENGGGCHLVGEIKYFVFQKSIHEALKWE
jgi:hypothetical protein